MGEIGSLSPLPTLSVGYSFLRFSTPDQGKGDSRRRQTEGAEAWCRENGVRLDKTLWAYDPAVSGYTGEHRKNPDRHALAAFLKLVESGTRVPRGSYLIVESLDRLTREHVRAALTLCFGLIEAGVRIVQLSPSEIVYDENADEMALILMIVELSRGHRESKRKSDMIGAVWANWRKDMEKAKGKQTPGRLPAWLEVAPDGTIRTIPARAAAVQRIYQLSAAGYGMTRIIQQLDAEGVEPFGEYLVSEGRHRSAFAGRWVRGYVGKLLRDRRVVGEMQPREGHHRTSRKVGDPVPDFFPAVVSEELWLSARAGMRSRGSFEPRPDDQPCNRCAKEREEQRAAGKEPRSGPCRHRMAGKAGGKGGRLGRVHLFSTLLFEARTRTPLYVDRNRLYSRAASEGKAPKHAFPLSAFETAILSALSEIQPKEVLGLADESGPDEVMVLSGEKARVVERIAALERELLEGEVPSIAKVLRHLEAQRSDIETKLQAARERAATPVSEAWGECKSLIEALAKAPDPKGARLRLRAALRRVIKSIWMVVVPRKQDRLAQVHVFFEGGWMRDYLIFYRPPRRGGNGPHPLPHPARMYVAAMSDWEPEEFDLNDPSGQAAEWAEDYLMRIPQANIDRTMASKAAIVL